MVEGYAESTSLELKLQFSAVKGFYLTLPTPAAKSDDELPDMFINVVRKKRTIEFATLELLQHNSRAEEALTEIYLMSNSTVTELLQVFRSHISVLYKVSEAIAMLDLLVSFGVSCTVSKYVRPEFTSTLAIKAGRHPITDIIQKEPVVANDTFASLSSSFQIITGANMSGKSTYIKQVALLTIMAQMGSYVPAEYASLRLCDQVLSRLANDSVLDMNTSSFMAEMRETAYVLQHVTPHSLVIVDELGRGTAPYDALGIVAAVCETLILSRVSQINEKDPASILKQAICFFATHLHQLTRALAVYPNVVCLQLDAIITQARPIRTTTARSLARSDRSPPTMTAGKTISGARRRAVRCAIRTKSRMVASGRTNSTGFGRRS
ncbi:muts domain V-domain-containing protein [Syncephalastrum racemosum]|uniref:Muts domain V-domain-containing protein n=1 Tax=Syncephalastrum racemosum TaxID=13706 RepID=A0A1X2HXM8_SYNRA|nr:muts domain V-domain-containing protein [Syncephalastrum racemosum]